MHFGRIFSFLLTIIGGSLLQLWVLMLILKATNNPVTTGQLLGDGGLFFFASSLAVGSAISLIDNCKIVFGNIDFIMTLLICFGLIIIVVAYYASILTNVGFDEPDPFANNIRLQIGCAFCAIAYWFYSGVRIGLFTKKDK